MTSRRRRERIEPRSGTGATRLPARPFPIHLAIEIALYVVLVLAVVLGGGSLGANWRVLLLCCASAVLLPLSFHGGSWGAFNKLPWLTRFAIFAIPLLPLAQLIPLPPDVWSQLPGRELAARIFELVGSEADWHPLTLAPRETLATLLFLLPPYAVFFGGLTLSRQAKERCVLVFLGVVSVSIMVGLIQLGSRGATLDFYGSTHRGNLIGFFANRNHQGLMIAIAAAFSIALVHLKVEQRSAVLAWSAVLSLTFLVAAVGTISRAGLGLTVLSLFLSNLALLNPAMNRKRLLWMAMAVFAIVCAGYFLSTSSVVDRALARFSQVGDDSRWETWRLSAPLVSQFFPWGSGFGTFVPAYAAIEPLDSVTPYYLNHAHNDYLELLIEAGIPGMAVLALFVASLLRRGGSLLFASTRRDNFCMPATVAILLIALHSMVDYPLRTQAMIVPFAIFLTFFLNEPEARTRVRRTVDPSDVLRGE